MKNYDFHVRRLFSLVQIELEAGLFSSFLGAQAAIDKASVLRRRSLHSCRREMGAYLPVVRKE